MLLPLAAVAQAGDNYAGVKQTVAGMLRKEMKKNHVTGLSIALVDDQRVVWAEGFGFADAAAKTPATADTLYRIGSISKIFTATEVMRLVEQGKVKLDQPLTRYVPEFAVHNRFPDAQPITVRALLAHHSGLPSDRLAGMWVQHPVSLAELVTQLHEESLATSPQTQYKYSNLDYSLLGRLIEKVDGQEFAAAMQQHLLTPLGMSHSAFLLTPEMAAQYAKGYRNGREADRTPLRDAPAGSLLSSVNDMSRFLCCLFADGQTPTGRLIGAEQLRVMWTPQFTGLPLDFGQQLGFGWMLNGLPLPNGEQPVWHNGGAIPFQAHLSLLPAKKLGVVILANTDEASQFITQVGIKTLALAEEAKYSTQPVTAASAGVKPVKLAHDVLLRYAGHYVVFNGQLNEITVDGDHLKTALWGQSLSLLPTSADTFTPKVSALFGLVSVTLPDLSLQFQTVAEHEVAVLRGLPAPFAFEKITPMVLPPAWQQRLGKYHADTTEEVFDFASFELSNAKGIFVANMTLKPKDQRTSATTTAIALRPISDTEAVVVGVGNGEGGVMRAVEHDGTTELRYSGFCFTRVK